MKRLMITGILILLLTSSFAQKFLLVENQKSFKNIKLYPGEIITFSIPSEERRISDFIIDLTNESIIFDLTGEVLFSEITAIYRDNYIVKILQPLTLLAGAAYFGLDSFNRLINNDSPVILAETAIISAGLVAFSFALTPFRQRKMNTGSKWQLRTIDLNDYGAR